MHRRPLNSRSSLFTTIFVAAVFAQPWFPVALADNKTSLPALRWAEGAPGCTFSRDDDGKYRYGLWTDDYGIILAVDSQELDKVRHRVEPFFSVHITVRYRGREALLVDPNRATLVFVKHFNLVQKAFDPESYAAKTQDDADQMERQTEREVKKHPEKKRRRRSTERRIRKKSASFSTF